MTHYNSYYDRTTVPLQDVIVEMLNRFEVAVKEKTDYQRWLSDTENKFFELRNEKDQYKAVAEEACRLLMSVYPNHSAEAIMENIIDRLATNPLESD